MHELVDSWAVRCSYAEYKNNMMTVMPVDNLVIHIQSGEGTHVNEKILQEKIKDEVKNYKFEKNIDYEIIEEYRNSFNYKYEDILNHYQKYDEKRYKFEAMYIAMDIWKKISFSGHNVREYFINRKYKRVAIYGYGKIGVHLKNEIANSYFKYICFIDNNEKYRDGKNCFLPSDDFGEVDCIVITVMSEIWNIKKFFNKENKSYDIKSIMDILKDR